MLGLKFGPAGPYVLDVLCCEAQEQRDHGRVKHGYTSLARSAFVEPGKAREIVGYAAEIGALDDLVEQGLTFTARVSGWESDQSRGRAAWRKQNQRARDAGSLDLGLHVVDEADLALDREKNPGCHALSPPATDSHGQSRSVTSARAHASAFTRPDQTNRETSSLRSDVSARAPRADKPTEPDVWPDWLAPEARQTADHVLVCLARVADEKNATAPTRRAVARVVRDFPDHDHRRIAGEFEHYWLDGGGKRTKRSDIVRTYRNRCEQLVATTRPKSAVGGGAESPAAFAARYGRKGR